MKIKTINLKKYKRFHDLTIDLGESPKRIVALIGPNGCGKSSVFDGISYLTNVYGIGYGYHSNIPDNYHNRYKDNRVELGDIKIIFDNGNDFIKTKNELQKRNKEHTLFSFRSPYRYTSSLKITQLKAVPEVIKNENGAKYTFDLDDKMTNNFQLFYTKITQYLREHPDSATYNTAINHYLNEVNISLKKCLDIEIVQIGEIVEGDGTLYFKKCDQEGLFDYNVLSSGEKEVVDMLLDIIVKKDTFTDSIFLFDEPELHINTSIQRKLLIEINRIVPVNCQIWIATHSVGFLRALEEDFIDDSQIIKFDGNYANEQTTLKPMLRTRKNFLQLYKTAVDDISELIAPKTIVYCEGKINPDTDGLDEFCYNEIFNEEYSDVLFISSGGCSELDKYSDIALMLLNKAFRGVELIRLKDRDINGNSENDAITSLEDRLTFLSKSDTHRMLLRREIENYLLDYEILKLAYPEIEKGVYDSRVTDINNQDLKPIISTLLAQTNRKSERGFNKEMFLKSLVPYITKDTEVYKELEQVIFNKQ